MTDHNIADQRLPPKVPSTLPKIFQFLKFSNFFILSFACYISLHKLFAHCHTIFSQICKVPEKKTLPNGQRKARIADDVCIWNYTENASCILPLRQACRERNRLPCWPLYSQQVSHQRWIWGIARRQESVQVRNPPWLWNPGRRHQKSKTGISVGPQKGLVS